MLTGEYKAYRTDLSDIMFIIQRATALTDSAGLSMTAVSSITFNDLEARVNYALNRQIQLLKESDQEYRTAVAVGDTDKQTGLENCFYYMARESVFECMVYI